MAGDRGSIYRHGSELYQRERFSESPYTLLPENWGACVKQPDNIKHQKNRKAQQQTEERKQDIQSANQNAQTKGINPIATAPTSADKGAPMRT